MAKYQYRVAGEFEWMSNSGNAIVAIMNPTGSGKKLTIRSLEATNLTSTDTATAGTVSAGLMRGLSVSRATVSGGDTVAANPLDTAAGAWPSTVRLVRNATVVPSGVAIGRVPIIKQMNQGSLSWMAMPQNLSPRWAGARLAPKRGSEGTVEATVIRAGEAVAFYPDNGNQFVPIRVTAVLVRSGTPNRTYVVTYFTHVTAINNAVLAIDNTAGSGETVAIREISFEEVGTYDSPYFQVVPMGPVNIDAFNDAGKQVTPLKMDSSYPSSSSWMRVLTDVPFLPLNMPENAASDGGAASPKGFNYLKTKDFIGPVWRSYFPEFVGTNLRAALPDALGFHVGHHNVDLGFRRAGITLREGEGLAIVSGAETAVVTTAVGVSGWSTWSIAAQIDVEPSISPTLTLTGLQSGTEVRIYNAGTTTLLAGQESVTTGSFSWVFDPADYPSVDISILALGYQNIRLTSFALSLADVTIPVQQQIDRQYLNP